MNNTTHTTPTPERPAPVRFTDAEPGDHAYIYTGPDVTNHTDFGWVTDLEWFDERERTIRLRRQRWQLIHEDILIFSEPNPICPTCDGDGAIDEVVTVDGVETGVERRPCPPCDGEGYLPTPEPHIEPIN